MSEATEVHPVSSRAWVEVFHAEVGARLVAAGIPCLHIKGPTMATWLYAPGERQWGDVDILVPPSRMDDLLEVLLGAGFSYRDPGLRWWTSEDHALTLVFDADGQARRYVAPEVDIHHRFLGMDGDPERVFAELWRRREPYRLAELEVWFPDTTTRALIAVLNAARDPHGPKAPTDLRRLLDAATEADWRRTIALARRVGALESLRAGLELEPAGRLVVASTALADVTVPSAVKLRAEGSSRTAVRLQELRTFGRWKKVKMLAGWVVPSPAVIRMREPLAAGSPRRMARAYLNRYRQGARELAATVRDARKRRSDPGPPPVPATTHDRSSPGTLPFVPGASVHPTANLRLDVSALADTDRSVALVASGSQSVVAPLVEALTRRGCVLVAEESTAVTPEDLEVDLDPPSSEPLEVRVLVVPQYDAGAVGAHLSPFPSNEVSALAEAAGWPTPERDRLARRVVGRRLRFADADLAAAEVVRLLREPPGPAVATPVTGRVTAEETSVPARAYRRPRHVGAAHDEDQLVLLDLRDGTRHVLSPTASAIWEALMSRGSLPAAVAELEEAFPDAPGLAQDTATFVASLEAQGLVERA